MSKIFVSYRRNDTKQIVPSIYNYTTQAFGANSVFVDTSNISAGEDFLQKISADLHQARIMLVVIGSQWLGGDTQGQRRIDTPNDPIRLEVRMGLDLWRQGRLVIIPVLIDDTPMPSAQELPPDIQDLARQNAGQVHSSLNYLEFDLNHLIETISKNGVQRQIAGRIVEPPNRWKGIIEGGTRVGAGIFVFVILAIIIGGIGFVGYTIFHNVSNVSFGLPLSPLIYQTDTSHVNCHTEAPFIVTLENQNNQSVNWSLDSIKKEGGSAWAAVAPTKGSIAANSSEKITITPAKNLCQLLSTTQVDNADVFIKTIDPHSQKAISDETEIFVTIGTF